MDTVKDPDGVAADPGPVSLEIGLCKACGVCIELCPDKVFDRDARGYPVVARPDDCSQCLLCELHCPDFAIEVRRRGRVATGMPAAEGSPALAHDADETPALTREDLVAASRGVHDDGCAHNGEEG